MNRMNSWLLIASCCAASAAGAVSSIGNVSLAADETGCVTITYSLSSTPTVVTLDVTTNGVSVGGLALDRVVGDANRVVKNSECTIRWWPTGGLTAEKIADANMKAVLKTWTSRRMPDYFSIDLAYSNAVPRYYESRELIPGGEQDVRYKTNKLLMRRIPAAGMVTRCGFSPYEPDSNHPNTDAEIPHDVALTYDYYMAVYETTRAQYEMITGKSLADGTDPLKPAGSIQLWMIRGVSTTNDGLDWPAGGHDSIVANSPIDRLRKSTSIKFDLPTFAEWEIACRAGTRTACYNGTEDGLSDIAWTYSNSGIVPHDVGEKEPNAWGLYDMLGNVDEWVLDRYSEGADLIATFGQDWTPDKIVIDPVGATSGDQWCICGGGFNRESYRSRACYRNYGSKSYNRPDIGFRVVCPVPDIR